MNRLLPFLFLVALAPSAARAEKPAAEAAPATDFIRVDEDDKAARLQTAVTRYENEGVTVDLVGAIHIADKKYYEDLNRSFDRYEALLFELVGGEKLVDGKLPDEGEEPDLQARVLRTMVASMSRFLQLSSQLAEIDYSKNHLVHADLTLEQFARKQEEKGESIFSFALAAAQNAENKGVQQPNPARLLAALLSGNSDGIKLEMIKTLGQGDDQIAALAGDNVIIANRNERCLEVLAEQVAAGKRTVGIFYGAAHFPDMEKRLLAQGYKKTGQQWMTAWNVPKPEPQPQPRTEPQNTGEREDP
ncbi:MAG: TraB/GumN family protein [Akkermansiaceae bacterium]|nr:TraB/GumN family protein [Akkermansiaceae bacterium]